MRVTQGSHVVIHSAAYADAASDWQRSADAAIEELCLRMDMPLPRQRAIALVFESRARLIDYLREECPKQMNSAAACFEKKGQFIIAARRHMSDARTRREIRHEAAHFAIASQFADVPPWLDEGLAQLAEHGIVQAHGEAEAISGRELLRDPAVAELIALRPGAQLSRRQYALARMTTRRLLACPEGAKNVKRYLSEARSDRDPEEQFIECFGKRSKSTPVP